MALNFKSSPKLWITLLIILFIGVSLLIRIYFPFDKVFVDDWVKYSSNDAYYEMRVIDNLAHNFPHVTQLDPYLIYPNGAAYGAITFFEWLTALIIWVLTLGSPTQHAVDMISMYLPAVLAALTVIPAYFIGKALFNRWAGVIAAAMIAVLPGEFIGRTILGGMDKPVAEILFTTIACMFLIYAIKASREKQLSWENVVKCDWKVLLKPLIFSLLGGLFLGIYLLTWAGALLFVFIITAYFIIQFIIDHFKGRSTFYLGFTGFFVFLVSFIIFQPVAGGSFHTTALVIAFLIPPALAAVSWLIKQRGWKAYYYPAALIVIAAVFITVFYLVKPDLFNVMTSQFSIFHPGGPTGATTIETQPFLEYQGQASTVFAYGNFTTSFFLIPSNLNVKLLRWIPVWEIIPLAAAVWLWARQRKTKKSNTTQTALIILLPVIAVIFWVFAPSEWKLWFPGFAFIGIFVLIWRYIKQRGENNTLLFLFVWTIIILVLTLGQRRFAYYLVINMALLSSYFCWQAMEWVTKKRSNPQEPETLTEQYKRSRVIGITGGIIAFVLSFILTGVNYFFIPVFILGLLSIFYGFRSWVKLKGKNEYMILWAFLFPIGIFAVALSKDETVKDKAKKPTKEPLNPWLARFSIATLIVLVFMAVFWPNYDKSKSTAAQVTYAPSDAWEETMLWMKDNTPEPLGTDGYYGIYNHSYVYPESAYGVTAWWDYGYWIMRTAHRMPSTNPSQSPEPIKKVANLFLSQDNEQARSIIKALDSSYVILDYTMTTTKLWAVATWAGQDIDKYTSVFYWVSEGQATPIQVFTPEYYKLLSVRLYNFDGKASTGEKPVVITYENRTNKSGIKYQLITEDPKEFESYQDAVNYVSTHQDKNTVIVGSNPYINPIPIEAVTDYSLIYSSTRNSATVQNEGIPEIKVFQYVGN